MRIMVPTLAAILGISTVASAQPPWPVNRYGAPYPQPNTLMPQVSPYYGYMSAPPNPGPGENFYYTPQGPMPGSGNPNPSWRFNYTPINPLLPRRSSNALPTYSSGPYPGNAGPIVQSGPTWPAPAVTPEVTRTPADPNADVIRMPVDFHRPTNECFWVSGDYSMAFIRPMRTPALVSTGPVTAAVPGALGSPLTTILFGQDPIEYNMFSGVRLAAGAFLDTENRYSIELAGFYQAPNTVEYRKSSDSNGVPTFGRPTFAAADGINREGILINAFPGLFAGSVAIDAKSQVLGVEFNARYHKYGYWSDRLHLDGLLGFRYLRLSESLDFRDTVFPLGRNLTFLGTTKVTAPNYLTDQDSFQTSNNFYGPQVGARVAWEERWVTFDGFFKLALGVTDQNVNIAGSTTLVTPTGSQTVQGGVLAQPSNIGRYHRAVFGIVPEFGVNLGVNVTEHVRVKLGYSFLMWSHVARPGTEIDREVNPGQVPGAASFGQTTGPARPVFRFNDEFFWTHFLNVGMEVHY